MRMAVTISRQLGSGGSGVGPLIARRLGLQDVDREILCLAAATLLIDEAELEIREERLSSFWEKMVGSFTLAGPDSPYDT